MNHGIFTVSLDFELHWGQFDKIDVSKNIKYFDNTLDVIPKMLSLFEQNNIEVTWATVGLLYCKSIKDLKERRPQYLAEYNNPKVSAYHYVDTLYNDKYARFYFAQDLIKKIQNTKGQELATHTYAHYYCLEKGHTKQAFDADLKSASKISESFGVHNKSIVMPRNQFNPTDCDIINNNNIVVIRTNPDSWCWNFDFKINILKKIARSADCYLPLFKTHYLLASKKLHNGLLLLPASRFFKPLHKVSLLNKLRIRRIKNEMTKAAKSNSCYHLWWHPHNFGINPTLAMKELEVIIDHFNFLNKTYNMKSKSMISTYDMIVKNTETYA